MTGFRLMGPPSGNTNALKTGLETAAIRSLRKRIRMCGRALRAATALAKAEAALIGLPRPHRR